MLTDDWRIITGDCVAAMNDMPQNSVDAIIADPPYYRVKNEPWDRQWDSVAGYLAWFDTVAEAFEHVLKPNGSLFVFAYWRMVARVEVALSERFDIVNNIVWDKADAPSPAKASHKAALRSFFPASERIIFAEHQNADNHAKGEARYVAKCDELRGFVFEPLRAYLENERKRAGVKREQVNEICGFVKGGMAGHYYSHSQWQLPTEQAYKKMRDGFSQLNHGGDYLTRSYEDLRAEYEDLRAEYEDLRRPFRVSADVQYTDVWQFDTCKPAAGKHPCEKPQPLLRHMLDCATRPNAVVLDPFMGTGSTGLACLSRGRKFIGIEKCERYAEKARERLSGADAQLPLLRYDTEQVSG